MALALVLVADWLLEFLLLLFRGEISPHGSEYARGLLAAHDRDARVGPHPQHARTVGAAAHAVIAGAEGAADDHRELGHRGGGHGRDHFRAVLRDAARLVFLSHHVAGDVLEEEER